MQGLLECPLTTRVEVQYDAGSGPGFGAGMKPFGQGSGYLKYKANCSTLQSVMPKCTQGNKYMPNRCPLEPRGELLAQRNPMCDVRTVRGGLYGGCAHGWHLLDADQELPWTDRPLTYWKKCKMVTLSRFVALSVSLTWKVSCRPRLLHGVQGGRPQGHLQVGLGDRRGLRGRNARHLQR